jgi:hypothetical protein
MLGGGLSVAVYPPDGVEVFQGREFVRVRYLTHAVRMVDGMAQEPAVPFYASFGV